jgi:hypothetical protein
MLRDNSYGKIEVAECAHIRGSQANIALASLPFVSKVDFADKSLNQTARIAKFKTQKVNKHRK